MRGRQGNIHINLARLARLVWQALSVITMMIKITIIMLMIMIMDMIVTILMILITRWAYGPWRLRKCNMLVAF